MRKPGQPLRYCPDSDCHRRAKAQHDLAAYHGDPTRRERTRQGWKKILPPDVAALPASDPRYRAARYAIRRGVTLVVCRYSLCPRAGEPFERGNKPGHPSEYCSAECRRNANLLRAQRHRVKRRNAKAIGEDFTLDQIYERDGGVCFLCGLDVPRAKASVEHLLPLNRGGDHVLINVALAHRSCNTRKSDRTLDEYLARWPRKRPLATLL